MREDMFVELAVNEVSGARSAPARRVARILTSRAMLALALITLAVSCRAVEAGGDAPRPDDAAYAPPAGIRLLPDLTLSGYATIEGLVPDARSRAQPSLLGTANDDDSQVGHHPRLDLSHLSGIAWWEPSPAWKVLGEIDLQDIVQVPAHSSEDGKSSEPYIALDRLYVDYRASDAVSLRAGKFLTPIGRWNQEHSDPQVWTVLRPLISQSAFPTSATGVMIFGSAPIAAQWFDYQVYASDGGEWRPSPRSHPFDSAVGARVSTELDPSFQLGVSVSHFRQDGVGASSFDLVGGDARLNLFGSEFSGEVIQRRGRDANVGEEHGWFVQAAVPVASRWWVVGRLEDYRRSVDESESRTSLLGLVYRSGRHWVFKAEWAQATGSTNGLPSGFLSSITMAY